MILAVADTHALVWALFGDARLSAAARTALTVSGEDKVGVSAISLAEIVYLEEKQRLAGGTFARVAAALADPAGSLEEIPVDTAVIRTMTHVPRSDIPDLPDRIIAASAVHLGVPVISRDGKIRASQLRTIW